MIITPELLKSLNACKDQVALFDKFLDGKPGVEFSPSNALCAKEFGLDVRWLLGKVDFPREVALLDPEWAYIYAQYVDKAPRDETREASCQDPYWAYRYALYVDKVPRDDTREAACKDPEWAFRYAIYVDEVPRDDTREAACKSPYWRNRYICYFGGWYDRNT